MRSLKDLVRDLKKKDWMDMEKNEKPQETISERSEQMKGSKLALGNSMI